MKFGMGLKVTNDTKQSNVPQEVVKGLLLFLFCFSSNICHHWLCVFVCCVFCLVEEADQHQRFAKSLGFYDDADWSLGMKQT